MTRYYYEVLDRYGGTVFCSDETFETEEEAFRAAESAFGDDWRCGSIEVYTYDV